MRSSYNRPQVVSVAERLISAASYLTSGIIGFLWIIIAHVTNSRLKNFVKFHVFQSIFLAILFYLFKLVLNILIGVAIKIPFVGSLVYSAYFYVFDFKFIFGFSFVDFTILVVVIYLVVNALLARIGTIPWVSTVVKGML